MIYERFCQDYGHYTVGLYQRQVDKTCFDDRMVGFIDLNGKNRKMKAIYTFKKTE